LSSSCPLFLNLSRIRMSHTKDTPPADLSRRHALLALAGGATVLAAGCGGGGGGDGGGDAKIRAINLTSDVTSADLFFNDDRKFAALATDTLSEYITVNDQEWTLRLKKANDATTLLSGSYSLGNNKNYTAVIWGRETSPRLSTLPEDEDDGAISAATGRLRVFNATLETGSLDIYVTSATANLAETAATLAGVTAGQLSSFRDISTGTYRLRITGAGDPNDLRLDVSNFVITEKKHATLVITPGTGGVLVTGRLILQQGSSTAQTNTKARVRVVAGANSAGNVGAVIGSTTLVGSLRSPSVGPYQLVDSGSLPVTVRLNGAVVATDTRTFVPGGDYTLLVYGTGQVSLIVDDNRLPALTSRSKLRLVHGAAGVDPLTLSVDFTPLSSDLPVGTASAYSTVTSSTTADIDVTAAAAPAPIFSSADVNLQSQAVYTVFVLGGNAAPTGVIRKER
jgi:hypothetical protein